MNTFAFIASLLAVASANPNGRDVFDIKDNKAERILVGKLHCDTKAVGVIKIDGEKFGGEALPFLYPVVQNDADIELFKAPRAGNPVKDTFEKTNGLYPAFEGHFAMADRQIKEIHYTANGRDTEYHVFVIPPDVSSGLTNGKPHQVSFNVSVVFTCGGQPDKENTANYTINVTNNARTVSLVSSALVLVVSSFLLL